MTMPARGWNTVPASLLDFYDWRDEAKTVELAANRMVGFNWAHGDRAERLTGAAITAGYLGLHGVPMLAGREFIRSDETAGTPIALIDERLGRDRYGGVADVIGRTMLLDGLLYTIVGIVPARFEFPNLEPDVWVPLARRAQETRAWRSDWVFGRLGPEATPATAQAELASIARRQEERYPETNQGYGIRVETAMDAVVPPMARRASWALLVAVGLVLLIACANVANLLLARTTGRAREIATRAAVGAGRGRIARLLLIESALLAGAGGALGLLLSTAGSSWFRHVVGPNLLGELPSFALSMRVLWYGLAVTASAALLFGLLPAIRCNDNVIARLRDGGRSETTVLPGWRWSMSGLPPVTGVPLIRLGAGSGSAIRSGPSPVWSRTSGNGGSTMNPQPPSTSRLLRSRFRGSASPFAPTGRSSSWAPRVGPRSPWWPLASRSRASSRSGFTPTAAAGILGCWASYSGFSP